MDHRLYRGADRRLWRRAALRVLGELVGPTSEADGDHLQLAIGARHLQQAIKEVVRH